MTNYNNHILVPIDFSEQSLIALEQSYNLARLTMADITLLYVMDEEHKNFFSVFGKVRREAEEKKYERGIKTKLKTLSEETQAKAGVTVKVMIKTGKIYDEIIAVATELNAAFIIMGTNGQVGLKKKFIGTNALRVVKEAHCPVITIKGKNHRTGCKIIVLPLDFSQETKEKVGKAIELANYFGSAINLVTIVNTKDEILVKKMTLQLKQVESVIKKNKIAVSSEFIEDKNISEGVLNYAKKVDADLIMIMTQSEMDWTDLFIGSTAQEIINNSEVPVLSIHPMDRMEESVLPFTF